MKKVPKPIQEFSYCGNLSEHPLPELLFTIGQYKVPGVLTFTLGKVAKQIFLNDGNVIFAASNSPEDHLGEFLLRCGKISRVDYDKSIEMLSRQKGKWQGEILIDLGALLREELSWAVRSHQQWIVWSLFNWFDGDVKFNIGTFRQSKPIQLDIPIPRAILEGVRQITHAKKVMTYMGNRTTVLQAAENALLTIELFGADDKERTVLKLVDGNSTLYDLCAKAPYSPHETARILYGLYTLRLVRRIEPDGIHVISTLPTATFQ
jgi:hypothetical protein